MEGYNLAVDIEVDMIYIIKWLHWRLFRECAGDICLLLGDLALYVLIYQNSKYSFYVKKIFLKYVYIRIYTSWYMHVAPEKIQFTFYYCCKTRIIYIQRCLLSWLFLQIICPIMIRSSNTYFHSDFLLTCISFHLTEIRWPYWYV